MFTIAIIIIALALLPLAVRVIGALLVVGLGVLAFVLVLGAGCYGVSKVAHFAAAHQSHIVLK